MGFLVPVGRGGRGRDPPAAHTTTTRTTARSKKARTPAGPLRRGTATATADKHTASVTELRTGPPPRRPGRPLSPLLRHAQDNGYPAFRGPTTRGLPRNRCL